MKQCVSIFPTALIMSYCITVYLVSAIINHYAFRADSLLVLLCKANNLLMKLKNSHACHLFSLLLAFYHEVHIYYALQVHALYIG